MPETITLSHAARWEIADDGTATFYLRRDDGTMHVHTGPIPWGDVQVGDTVIHLLAAGYTDPTEGEVLAAGEEMLGYPLGGRTWQKPAPFRIRDVIQGVRTARVENTYVNPLHMGYVVRHRYARWLALDLEFNALPVDGGGAGGRGDGLYANRQEAVHRVIAAYRPADRDQAIVRADALYEEASRLWDSLDLLQTLLREEGRGHDADTLDLPLARAHKYQERCLDAMQNITGNRDYRPAG